MTEEEKEVIRMIKTGLEVKVEGTQIETIILKRKNAEILLNLIQKQEKIIDKMAKRLNQYGFFMVELVNKYETNSEMYLKAKNVEEIKQYFERQVEENGN